MPFAAGWAMVGGRRALLVVATAAVSLSSYIAYNDFWPYALWRVYLVHYVVWTLPVLAAAGMAGVVIVIRDGRWRIAAAASAVAALLLTLQPVAAAAQAGHVSIERHSSGETRYEIAFEQPQEIDAIDLIGATTRDAAGVTMKSFDVTQDGRSLAVISGYRALQLRRGIRIVFNRHIVARRLALTLGTSIATHPADPAAVRALEFNWTVAAFRAAAD
jgi:hypothetical protein